MNDRRPFFKSPQELLRAAINSVFRHEKAQAPKRQTRYDYTQGPMYFLGQQIVKHMQDAGYPAKILYCHRSAAHQRRLYAQGRTAPGPIVTRARPWSSAHQYFEAVDIIHPSKAWEVSEAYWDTLATVVGIVAEKYGVDLQHGHDWDGDGVPVHLDDDERFRDSAHIQLKGWRHVRDRHRQVIAFEGEERPPNDQELWDRFCEVLPDIAKRLAADQRTPKGVETPPAFYPKRRVR